MNCEAYRVLYEEPDAHDALGTGARAHLAACEACGRLYRERAALRQLLGGLERVTAPADFEFRLRARMRANTGTGSGPGFAARLFSPAAASALAACALLIITAGVYFKRTTPPIAHQPESGSSVAQNAETPAPQAKASNENGLEIAANGGTGNQKAVEVTDETLAVSSSKSKTTKPSMGFQKVSKRAQGRADLAARAAPVLIRREGEVTFVNPPVAVQLPASRQPLRVMLRDERGASREFSMRPVNFGSHEFVSRLGGPLRPSNTSKEGVW